MRTSVLVLVMLVCSLALGQTGPASRPVVQRLLLPPPGELYHGVYPGGQSGEEDDITAADVSSYESTVGKRVAWVYFSNNWYSSTRFPLETAEFIRQGGAVPFIRLMLRGEDNTQGEYTVERILAGQCDALLQAWAREAKGFGTPLAVEYGTEVNGQWFPWNGLYHGAGKLNGYGSPSKPDGPERFVAAYRRIVTVMRDAGARNITWVFHVDATDDPEVGWNKLENYYPGDEYVDWIGVSAYGPQEPMGEDCPGFREQMDSCYARLTALAPAKPVIALEFGCTAGSPLITPEAWAGPALDDLLARRWTRVIGFSWWNERWQNDDNPAHDSNMRVQDSPALAEVFSTKLAAAGDIVVERPLVRAPRESGRFGSRIPRDRPGTFRPVR